MGFNRDVIRRLRDEMNEMGVRVRWAGRKPRLWASVIKELEIAEELTKNNTVMNLTMCVNYGGRAEIADAVKEIAKRVVAGEINRSEEHTSELQSLMRISYAVFCLKKKKENT